jgi:xylulokinase
MELQIPEQQIGASYGDAFLAATGSGLFQDLSQIKQRICIKETVRPGTAIDRAYETNYRIFRELYTHTKGLMQELSQSQTS